MTLTTETWTDEDGNEHTSDVLDIDALADHLVDLIVTRKPATESHGIVVLAEGLAKLLPKSFLDDISRDDHGHISRKYQLRDSISNGNPSLRRKNG